MPKIAKVLSAIEVRRLAASGKDGLHAAGTVAGLNLQRTGASTSWLLRVRIGGQRAHLGLGAYPEVTLGMAIDIARQLKQDIKKGIDPRTQRRLAVETRRAEQRQAESALATFRTVADDFLFANEAGWSNPKHAQQWRNTLATYVHPLIGDRPVSGIVTDDVLAVLQQPVKGGGTLWTSKTETASRVRQRIEAVLDSAKARGLRTGDNAAEWKGNLSTLLPKASRVTTVKHHEAMPWKDVPAFMTRLREQGGTAARMLEFAILCASRSAEVRGLTWGEVNIEDGLWIVPAARMKAGREHRVALSKQAIELLKALPSVDGTDLVFPSPRKKAFSDAAMAAVLKRMNVDVTQHGFRSAFRDWAAETTAFPADVAELALAHAVGTKVTQAYQRGDLLEKRRELAQAWANYCDALPANVSVLRPAAA
jgi:integrase